MPRPRKPRVAPSSPGGRTDENMQVQSWLAYELNRWLDDLQPLWLEWDSMLAKWGNKPVDPNKNPFLASFNVPYGLYVVEQILPRIIGANPTVSYAAIDYDTDDLVASLASKVAKMQMQRMGFEYACRDFIRQALISDYSVAKVGWTRVERTQIETTSEMHPVDPANPEAGQISVRVEQPVKVVTCNEPFFEVVNVKDFIWPLTARSIAEAPAVWQRRFVPLTFLREMEQRGFYRNVDDVNAADSSYWVSAYQQQFSDQGLKVTVPDTGEPTIDGSGDTGGLVELWERWEDDRVSVIANRNILLRDDPNPFWHKRKPFVDYAPIPRPFQMNGLGLMKLIDDSNEHLNTLMRQLADAATYSINPIMKGTEGIDRDDWVMQPGAFWPMPDTDDVQPLVIPQVNFGGAVELRQEILQDMQKTTGVFDLMGGVPLSGMRTATGVSTVIQQATMRIAEFSNVLDYRAMRPLGYMLLSMNAQYLDSSVLVDLSDDPKAQAAWEELAQAEMPDSGLVHVTPEMLSARGRLEPIPQVGQDEQNRVTQERSDAEQAAQAIAPILASPQNPIDMRAFADWMLKKFGVEEADRKKIVTTPPVQELAQATDAAAPLLSAVQSGPSGPSGENAPTGGVRGAAGASGGIGPPGLGT